MDFLLILTLPIILIYGIITSYQDYKFGIIKNKLVLYTLSYGVIATILYSSYIFITKGGINVNYIIEFSFNIMISILSAFILWYGGLWSAGDAKLFIGYAIIIPLSIYKWGYIYGFPAYIILTNTFIPIFLFYFILIILKTTIKQKKDELIEVLSIRNVLTSMLVIFGFKIIVILSHNYSNFASKYFNNSFIIIAIMFSILLFTKKFFDLWIIEVAIIFSILNFIFFYKIVLTLKFAKSFFLLSLLFLLIRYYLINLGHIIFSKEVFIEDLKPGMIPSENIVILNNEYFKKKISIISFLHGLLERHEDVTLFHKVSDGLSKKEIKKIQRLHSQGKFKSHSIKIGLAIPFAHFIFIGVLMTIIFKGNLIIAIFKILETFI